MESDPVPVLSESVSSVPVLPHDLGEGLEAELIWDEDTHEFYVPVILKLMMMMFWLLQSQRRKRGRLRQQS